MSKINSKSKGNRGELELVKILNEKLGEDKKVFARVPQSGGWGGGQNRQIREDMSMEQKLTLVADIMTPPNFKFVLEHKFYEESNFWDLFNEQSNFEKWTNQVSEDSSCVNKEPMLIIKYNRKPRIVLTKVKIKYKFSWVDKNNNTWYCNFLDELLETYEKDWWFE